MKFFQRALVLSCLFIIILICTIGCESTKREENLAKTYCGSCHLAPEPGMLDKASWKNGVLPSMAIWTGVSLIENSPKYDFEEIEKINALHVLPEQPMMNPQIWKLIEEYYIKNAPEKLPLNSQIANYQSVDSIFSVKPYPFTDNEITMLKFDKTSGQLNLGTREGKFIQVNSKDGQILNSFDLHSPPTDIVFRKDSSFGISVAGKLEPNHDKNGICAIARIENGRFVTKNILNQLPRPVSLALADLNQDNEQDAIVCSFGYFAGKLSWYEFPKNAPPVEHLLKEVAGATCVLIEDLNHDKLPDIIALMGQGNEGVFIFYNKGKGVFEEEQVLKFPPVYGSLHIELQDFNRDGFPDILYSNGDNGDESPVLKPYHGIRIFLNDGKNHFTEKCFFPMYGAIKSVARDFDGDGDLDIAAISFFPDYESSPQKSFVFLQNEGTYVFKPYISSKTDTGRWMVMDAFDYDNDGDEDILLGACYEGVKVKNANSKSSKTFILLLENRKK